MLDFLGHASRTPRVASTLFGGTDPACYFTAGLGAAIVIGLALGSAPVGGAAGIAAASVLFNVGLFGCIGEVAR